MATTSLATIYNRALRRLKVLGRGQTANAEDTADMTEAYKEVYYWLDRRNLVSWDVTDAVPTEFVNDVVALIANSRLDEYSVPEARRVTIERDASAAPFNISKVQLGSTTGETEIEYY